MNSMMEVRSLDIQVPGKQLFKNLSFTIPAHKLTCMTGENGVGKTTLVKHILQSFKTKDDRIIINTTRARTQYVPQLRNIDDEFPLSVHDFVGLGLHQSNLLWHTKSEKKLLQDIIQKTHLTTIANHPLGAASGGEKQRAFLAQALCAEPNLLILDESTASLDTSTKNELLALIRSLLTEQDITVLFITHDPELIEKYADYELHLSHLQAELIRKEHKE
ncbi:metal ABC transporter ATP-binding protein [Liquorilactobacillus mali]|nr:ATP-binding cassette domain-containing protein [Liquorilactobacillus mali]EJF01296.1 ABC transporter ATP-binding protein [Liquorilactobacillus mali KCTC 3596 = DSM 20444]MDV7758759.1 ATP-binding cassette domain-containing protein [Liquorilactobacillus mali]QFQ75646.1 ATP-binding cassette domain-containing protein [Liquorilactobacillus mali]